MNTQYTLAPAAFSVFSAPPNLQLFLALARFASRSRAIVGLTDNQALGIKRALLIVMAEAGLGR